MLDGDDRHICRELLYSARVWGSELKTLGMLIEGLGTLTPAEFRWGIDRLRERAGLPSLKSIEVDEQLQRAQHRRVTQPIGTLVAGPSGGFVDLDEVERDSQRERITAQRAKRQRLAELDERAAEVVAARQRQAATARRCWNAPNPADTSDRS